MYQFKFFKSLKGWSGGSEKLKKTMTFTNPFDQLLNHGKMCKYNAQMHKCTDAQMHKCTLYTMDFSKSCCYKDLGKVGFTKCVDHL